MPLLPQAEVVIVGRTNVGKSSLFNRLVGGNKALVSSEAGTTRDTNLGLVNWRGQNFLIYDSGGIDPLAQDPAGQAGLKKLNRLIKTSRLIIFVIDGQTGLLDKELELIKKLQRWQKNVIVAVNKIDGPRQRARAPQQILKFTTQLLSAKTGVGVGDLLDAMWPHINKIEEPKPSLKLAIIGQTNVGKSLLFNRLLNAERSLVLATPHTTRDRQHHYFFHFNTLVELVDTAGVRRQINKAPTLETQSVQQAMQILPAVDVILLVIDARQKLSWQDQALADAATKTSRPVVIILNKADLVELEERKIIAKSITHYLPMLSYAPCLWVSALSGHKVYKIIPLAEQIKSNWQRRLSDAEIIKFTNYIRRLHPIKNLPLVALEQIGTAPPRFQLRFNTKVVLPTAVARWVEGKLRHGFDFSGTPIKVNLQNRAKS
ncbi:MAG: ribosome biogenesis GTPase Der [Patescibacteria group bacterium]